MDNRDLQLQLDKASQESEIKPFTIQDLIRFAERDGIKCENCALLYKPFENTTLKYKDHIECRILQVHTPKNIDTFFCANFKQK
jgi:hypothetical protein